MRNVLITGATGTVSGLLLDVLEGSDLKLSALIRDPDKAEVLEARGVEVRIGDLGTPESLPAAFEGIDAMWLLNGMTPRAPENSMNAVWAAKAAGVEQIVRLSAVGAAHDAPTRNGRLHVLSDVGLEASGIRWTILRPHFFMQNLLGSAPTISGEGAFYLNMGSGRLGMVDVRDVAEMGAKLLTEQDGRHDGKIYVPTGPAAISFAEAATAIGEATSKEVSYVAVDDDAAREAMLGAGFDEWLVGMLVEYGQAYAGGWGDFTTADVEAVLGRQPRGFAQFAADHAPVFGAAAELAGS